jgi:hypothetical protein
VLQVVRPLAPLLAELLDLVLLGLDVHLDAVKVPDAGLGVPAILLGGLQFGHQSVGLVGAGDGLCQSNLGGGELRDLGQEVLSLGTTLLPGLDVVGDLTKVRLERLGAERAT